MQITFSYPKEFEGVLDEARALYGQDMMELEGIGTQLDLELFAKRFFKDHTADVSVDPNANVAGKDAITYNYELPKPFMRLNSMRLLWGELKDMVDDLDIGGSVPSRVIKDQIGGRIYINDFNDVGRPYCFNYSTYDIALGGLPMGGRVKPVPPKHLTSFMRQVEQFTVYAANSTLGATGLADLLIVMSLYVDKVVEAQADDDIKFATKRDAWRYCAKRLDKFIYTVNWEFRGNQSPFTNVSLYDKFFLKSLCPSYVLDGRTARIGTVQWLQKEYLKIMNKELARAPLTFPVATACFAKNDDGKIRPDKPFLRTIAKANLPFGALNFYSGKSSTLSSCCRLRSEADHEYFNSFGAGSTKLGSLGVVTLNLPRLAFEAQAHPNPRNEFLNKLRDGVTVAAYINHAKRRIIQDRINRGALPLYSLGIMDLKKQYSTLGLTGLNEALELLGYDILTEAGQEFVLHIMNVINALNDQMTKKFNYPHNCEQVPAESSAVKLARKDHLFGYNRNEDGSPIYPLYSNQFIPLTTQADMLDRMYLQGLFDQHFSGGAICHINVSERITDWHQMADLIKTCAEQGVIYWAVNYALQMCEHQHMTVGNSRHCPICGGAITDHFTRVVGFLTNTKHWNATRRMFDWPNRQFYQEV